MVKDIINVKGKYKIIHGDCMKVLKQIPDNKIDLVLCDPPYGTMKGIDEEHDWDVKLPTGKMFEQLSRVVRPNGKVVLFSQEPYTSELIQNTVPSLPFNYRAIWYKDSAGNSLMAKQAMISRYEDINVFSKQGHDYEGTNPLREYFKAVLEYIGKTRKEIMDSIGQCADHCFRIDSTQYSLCTKQTYDKLVANFNIDKMQGFRTFEDLDKIQKQHNTTNPSVFNLWQGTEAKSNVLVYGKDKGNYHPTQKPVLLLADLIKTFSNEGDLVLDFTMGSGSTGVASVRTNRKFIGIEQDTKYFRRSAKRIEQELQQKQLT